MNKTFIFGHKRPDSDATMSAIALSYLKNQLGGNTEPRILGSLNKETEYAINYFGLKTPEYLNDVKLQLKDVNYHKDIMVNEKDSIYNAYQLMLKNELTGIPVVKEDNEFVGLITIKDLSRVVVNENVEDLDTSYDNIKAVLDGERLVKANDDYEIKGKLLVAAYEEDTFVKNIKLTNESVLIVGDRHPIIKHAIKENVKLIIVSGNNEVTDEELAEAKANKVSIIRTKYDTYHIANLIKLTNYVSTMIRSYNPTKFEDTEFVSTIMDINNKLKHTNYPVVDKNNKCLGLLRITDLNEKSPKNVILVDHNEKAQSAEGIEEANIVEIVDHHNLGSITTAAPINFRNMAVGSTCTICYTLYKENRVEIPKEIAGAMLTGILSDTLILKSPTATALDKEVVEELAKIAGVDYEKYGMDMLKAGTSIEGMSKEDILYNDFKQYNVGDYKMGIGQFFTMNFEEMEKELDEYVKVLDQVSEANGYNLVTLYVTDIIKNGSYVIYNTKGKEYLDAAYNGMEVKEGFFVEKCVSRKKNVVPLLMPVFEN